MKKRRMVVILPNEKCDHMRGSPQQLPLKHYLEDSNYHLEQQHPQQVTQKRRKLNESSNSIQLHLGQQRHIKIKIQAAEDYVSFEGSKLGKPLLQRPINMTRSRCPRRFRGSEYITSKPNTKQNYSQQSSNETVQFKTYSVSIVNNNNDSLGSSFQERSRINKRKFLLVLLTNA
jgi:hypothetical protein